MKRLGDLYDSRGVVEARETAEVEAFEQRGAQIGPAPAPCFSCGEQLPDRYALLVDGRGACPGCVEAKQLESQVHAWKNRALEEPQ